MTGVECNGVHRSTILAPFKVYRTLIEILSVQINISYHKLLNSPPSPDVWIFVCAFTPLTRCLGVKGPQKGVSCTKPKPMSKQGCSFAGDRPAVDFTGFYNSVYWLKI